MSGIVCSYLLTLRPGSHDQDFCTIFWHQSYETWCKSMTHYCGHLSSITLNSPYEKENQTLVSFADFLRRNRTELYFSSKFSKDPPFSTKKIELLAVPLKTLSRRIQKNVPKSGQKKNASRLPSESAKRNFASFVLIDNDVF